MKWMPVMVLFIIIFFTAPATSVYETSNSTNWLNTSFVNTTIDKGDGRIKIGLYRDNFDDGNEDLTENNTVGGTDLGRYVQAVPSGSVAVWSYMQTGNLTNYYMTGEVNISTACTSGITGFMHHYNNNTNFYFFRVRETTDNSELYIFNPGATLLDQTAVPVAENVIILFANKLFNGDLTQWIDYSLEGTASDTAITSGSIGMRATSTTVCNIFYDNISILPLDGAGTIMLKGNTTHWYDAGAGFIVSGYNIQAVTPTGSNYTISQKDNVTGAEATLSAGTVATGGWINGTISGTKYQFTDIILTPYGNETITPEEIVFQFETTNTVAPAPNVTSWQNNYTNNANLSFTVEMFTNVSFNATINQTLTGCTWTGATQVLCLGYDTNATKNFTVAGNQVVSIYGTSSNGTTQTITWNVNVNNTYPTPAPVLPTFKTTDSALILFFYIIGIVFFILAVEYGKK